MIKNHKNNHKQVICISAVSMLFVVIPTMVFAQPDFGLSYLNGTSLPTADLRDVVINIINILIGMLGVLLLLLIMYGGFLWMIAGGNDDQAAKGRKIIGNAITGLLVIFLSFAVTTYVFNVLEAAA